MMIKNPLKRKTRFSHFVEPDEIFLDSANLPDFDTQQFEGQIEHPIRKSTIYALGGGLTLVLVVFLFFAGKLQIIRGQELYEKSERNSLSTEPIFAERGIITDRTGTPLAWNQSGTDGDTFPYRTYIDQPGFGHLLGYVSYPSKDQKGIYWQTEFIGKAGIEAQHDDRLKGQNGARIIERDALSHVISENITNPPAHGENLQLTVDADVTAKLYEKIVAVAHTANYKGGAGVMIDVHTGEVIALSSYPEYDPTVLSLGDDKKTITQYFNSPLKPFLNRAIGGLYSPGSIIKPVIGLAALKEGVIDQSTKILSSGSISIPNPYVPDQPSIFKDYAKDNGWVDLRRALMVSSNIYFYEVGGGYRSQKGIGIANIKKYANLFGLGSETGIDLPGEQSGTVPDPEWKEKNFPGDPWRIGDTYHTAIGQYGFQVTPIQMARVVSAIANGGQLLHPHLVSEGNNAPMIDSTLDFPLEDFRAVQEGMRLVATTGTARTFLNLPFDLAAKTGTAQVGVNNEYINSWTMTFFPYEQPKYALVVMMEKGPATNTIGSQLVAHDFLDWLALMKPEYTK